MGSESFSKFALRATKVDREAFVREHPNPFIIVDSFDPLSDEPIMTENEETKDGKDGPTIEDVLDQEDIPVFAGSCRVAVLSISHPSETFVIGRHIDSDLSIEHARISRSHVAFKRDNKNQWFITDLDTVNGTIMDRTTLEPNRDTPIKWRTRIILGRMITIWVLRPEDLWDEAQALLNK